jgi:hypothetical protein
MYTQQQMFRSKDFSLFYRDLKTALLHIAEQVKKDVNECLVQHNFSQMDDQKAQSLHGQICDLAVPTNTIMKLMSKLCLCRRLDIKVQLCC